MSRQENLSSATLFFGPSIPAPIKSAPALRPRTSTGLSAVVPSTMRSGVANRHSYAGPGSSPSNLPVWSTIQTRKVSVSPKSSPPVHVGDKSCGSLDDEDMFFSIGPQDSSFVFSVTEGTPSPRSKNSGVTTLPRKFKPRDSGVVMSDDDDVMSLGGGYLNVMPTASTSVGSVHSDVEDNLVTPGFGPDTSSGWPSVFVTGMDDPKGEVYSHLTGRGPDVDAFIMRTLAAATKGFQGGKKKVPGTPVKRMKMTYLAGERPWQSAVAAKVGLRFEWDNKKGKAPRKSLPAAFPSLGKKAEKASLDQTTDSEDEEDSPSGRKGRYGIGIGRPSAPSPEDGPLMSRTRWLMRRSSSGAFSSGSESPSSVGTPTRMKSKGLLVCALLFCAELMTIFQIGTCQCLAFQFNSRRQKILSNYRLFDLPQALPVVPLRHSTRLASHLRDVSKTLSRSVQLSRHGDYPSLSPKNILADSNATL